MHWCALTRHTWKLPEYSKTPSVLFTVIKLKTSGISKLQISRIFFYLRKSCLKSCKVNWFYLFVWGSWKFPRLLSFRFSSLYWQRKLGKLGQFFKASKFKWTSFFYLRKLESSEISEFSILAPMLKSKTRKTFQNISQACKVKWICSV